MALSVPRPGDHSDRRRPGEWSRCARASARCRGCCSRGRCRWRRCNRLRKWCRRKRRLCRLNGRGQNHARRGRRAGLAHCDRLLLAGHQLLAARACRGKSLVDRFARLGLGGRNRNHLGGCRLVRRDDRRRFLGRRMRISCDKRRHQRCPAARSRSTPAPSRCRLADRSSAHRHTRPRLPAAAERRPDNIARPRTPSPRQPARGRRLVPAVPHIPDRPVPVRSPAHRSDEDRHRQGSRASAVPRAAPERPAPGAHSCHTVTARHNGHRRRGPQGNRRSAEADPAPWRGTEHSRQTPDNCRGRCCAARDHSAGRPMRRAKAAIQASAAGAE